MIFIFLFSIWFLVSPRFLVALPSSIPSPQLRCLWLQGLQVVPNTAIWPAKVDELIPLRRGVSMWSTICSLFILFYFIFWTWFWSWVFRGGVRKRGGLHCGLQLYTRSASTATGLWWQRFDHPHRTSDVRGVHVCFEMGGKRWGERMKS